MKIFGRDFESEPIARWSLAVVFGWLGVMGVLEGGDALGSVLADHLLLPEGAAALGTPLAVVGGILQIGIALTLMFARRVRKAVAVASLSAVALAVMPLTLLFTNSVWIDTLGGFPAIGSGQGFIKYLAIVGLARFVHASATSDTTGVRHARIMMLTGLMLPLVWIGGMKFTELEAQGIEPLLSTSPFFAWMLSAFSLQTASIMIGVGELITAALLAAWWLNPMAFRLGAALTIGTFTATLSFLITLPGWHGEFGFPLLNGAGIFIIKDVALLAAAMVLFLES